MKFTIRDLFLVTVIMALALGWWLDRSRQSAAMSEATAEIEQAKNDAVAWEDGYTKLFEDAERHGLVKNAWGWEWTSERRSLPTSSAPAPPKP